MKQQISTDYEMFIYNSINRKLNLVHVRRLAKSIAEHGLQVPIWVTPEVMETKNFIQSGAKYRIVDGHHRFEACKYLSIPVQFVIREDVSASTLAAINSTSRIWNNQDYLDAFVKSGKEDYIKLQNFMNDNPDFPIRSCIVLLSNVSIMAKKGVDKMFKSPTNKTGSFKINNAFQDGDFTINNYQLAHDSAKRIRLIAPFYTKYSNPTFVRSMKTLFNYDKYDHNIFLNKLMQNPLKLTDAQRVGQYLQQIQDIYNYRNKNPQLFTHLVK